MQITIIDSPEKPANPLKDLLKQMVSHLQQQGHDVHPVHLRDLKLKH